MATSVEFKRTQSGSVGGREAACYSVFFPGGKLPTVGDFVQAVFEKYPGEWGKFMIRQHNKLLAPISSAWYESGHLKDDLPDAFLDMKIKEASANGRWSRMDYILNV